jgi:tetratricopeptide (TPR) repeat protein
VAAPPPAGADAPLELPESLRREVLSFEAARERLTHWDALGLRWGADVDAARAAYVERVKRYHPDRHGGRRLGAWHERLCAVVARLTEARDVLCDPARRRAYEEATAPPEEKARREAHRIEQEQRADERRARLARTSPLLQKAARVNDLVARGKQALAEGRPGQAANDFLTALAMDPRHAEAKALAEDAKRRAGVERARDLYEAGLRQEAAGRLEAALATLREAMELAPREARYPVAASHAALRLGRVDDALALARGAARLGAADARALEALGAALVAAGEKREAKKALERALELDGSRAEAKRLLRTLRWSPFG